MRKIIHVDCDCFYAAVEQLDNPRLKGRPVAVGGRPDSRGVIATANYEARRFGIRSAMPASQAVRACPDLLILPPRFERYKAVSRDIRDIFSRYTDRIEPLSLDEAYLDVSGQPHHSGSATRMAEAIREDIRREIGITVSAGVAPNKFLAKIASEWNKPNGLFVIPPDGVADILRQLPVEKLHGVGKVTAAKLHAAGLRTCGDVQGADSVQLTRMLGSAGPWIQRLSHGIDDRPVQTEWVRKSVSVEHTFARDLPSLDACRLTLPGLMGELHQRLRHYSGMAIRTAVVKLKFADFTQTTRECRWPRPDATVFDILMREAFERGQRPVRLIGVGIRFDEDEAAHEAAQLPLPLAGPLAA